MLGRGFESRALCLAFLLLHPGITPDALDGIREAFLSRINGSRLGNSLPPMRLKASLSRQAQQRAEEIASGGTASDQSVAKDAAELAKAGYSSKSLAEVAVQAEGDVDLAYQEAGREKGFSEEIGRRDWRDLGVGLAMRENVSLFVFLFGLSWDEFVADKQQELSDLAAVRERLVGRVNRERRARGVAPLRASPLLDRTAQAHAQDMLARSYYGHQSPEGSTVFERSRREGYRPRFVAENIARGQYAIEEVMDGWMASEVHREHIVSPTYADVGSGVAVGKNANGYQIIWVQCFGRAQDASPEHSLKAPIR